MSQMMWHVIPLQENCFQSAHPSKAARAKLLVMIMSLVVVKKTVAALVPLNCLVVVLPHWVVVWPIES